MLTPCHLHWGRAWRRLSQSLAEASHRSMNAFSTQVPELTSPAIRTSTRSAPLPTPFPAVPTYRRTIRRSPDRGLIALKRYRTKPLQMQTAVTSSLFPYAGQNRRQSGSHLRGQTFSLLRQAERLPIVIGTREKSRGEVFHQDEQQHPLLRPLVAYQ